MEPKEETAEEKAKRMQKASKARAGLIEDHSHGVTPGGEPAPDAVDAAKIREKTLEEPEKYNPRWNPSPAAEVVKPTDPRAVKSQEDYKKAKEK